MDSEPLNVTIIAGKNIVIFDVPISDNLLENNMFTLTIKSSSLPSSINVGDPNQTTVTIMEDYCKHKIVMMLIIHELNLFHSQLHNFYAIQHIYSHDE